MKRVTCTICLMLVMSLSGCPAKYWYRSGTSLEQCLQDSNECLYDARKHAYPYDVTSLYIQCMDIKGYQKLNEEQLPSGIRANQIGTPIFVDVFTIVHAAGR